jgi:hypothetical protein
MLLATYSNVDLDMASIYVVETAYKLGNGRLVIKDLRLPAAGAP